MEGSVEERVARAVEERLGLLFADVVQRLEQLEGRLAANVVKESYTVEEAAGRLGRSEWTVRQWCNKGQVRGAKKAHGRGRTGEWRIPHDELTRLQNEGPSPAGGGGRAT
jgi:Helix-turn-helix domain